MTNPIQSAIAFISNAEQRHGYMAGPLKAELMQLSARIADLEAQLSAVGAGGVEPLRKQAVQPAAHPAEGVPAQSYVVDFFKSKGFYPSLVQAFAAGVAHAAATQPAAQGMTEAARSVLAERARQIAAEGWTPANDDGYAAGTLSDAAGCYAMQAYGSMRLSKFWPWSEGWWKPSENPRRNLEKAGALILAEIECIDRTYAAQTKQGGA